MADKSNFNETVNALFRGMDSFVTTKTVVGEAQKLGDITIVPLADVSFGIGAGAFAGNGKNNDGGGLGGKITPSAVLVIAADGSTKIIRTDEKEDLVSRLVNMAPGLISKFTGKSEPKTAAEELADEAGELAAKAARKTADAILDGEE